MKEGVAANLLEAEELAAGVAACLAVTATPTYMMRILPVPGGSAAAQDMRGWLKAWVMGLAGTDQHLATLVQERLTTTCASLGPLRALTGAARTGLGLPVWMAALRTPPSPPWRCEWV